MDKVQKFKMMMDKRYGDEFEFVLEHLYKGDVERMYLEFKWRKEVYPYYSYKQTLGMCCTHLSKIQKKGDIQWLRKLKAMPIWKNK